MDEEHRHVFRWARKHWATYGTGPTSQAILRERPTYKLTEDTPEPIAYYVEEVWKQYSYDVMVRATTPCAPGHARPTTKFRGPSACTHGLDRVLHKQPRSFLRRRVVLCSRTTSCTIVPSPPRWHEVVRKRNKAG